jgi:HD-GYP domain-containing protein (c-di-GMP phosphodiesterase class II)
LTPTRASEIFRQGGAAVTDQQADQPGDPQAVVTWPELMAATSLAADTGMALPLETGLATCLVAMELGRQLDLDDAELTRTYRLSLLQHIGCTAAAQQVAEVVGDEMLMREHAVLLNFADQREMFSFMLAHVGRANPLLGRPGALARALVGGSKIVKSAEDVCEAAQLLGERAGYESSSLVDLARVYEAWDGSGFPLGMAGDDIPVPVQVVQVASLAVNAERLLGADGALALVNGRSGGTLAPAVAAVLLAHADAVFAPLRSAESLWDRVIEAEPRASPRPSPADVDRALAALADLADLKSPFHVGHSSGVADLAAAAGRCYGLPETDVTLLRRAGYVHDIGRIAVSSAIWGSTRPLSPDQREQVRMHPYRTLQVLDRSPFLRSLAGVATAHHERLDGSGYHRGLTGPVLSLPARILAAADTYHAKTERRPHRPPLTPRDAAAHLRSEVQAGRLDSAAVDAVLDAAGEPAPPRAAATRLTPREIEILGHVAEGGSMREIAKALSISPKTVDGHLQRIYPKIGVSTRTGATLYAMEHGLLPAQRRAQVGENSP